MRRHLPVRVLLSRIPDAAVRAQAMPDDEPAHRQPLPLTRPRLRSRRLRRGLPGPAAGRDQLHLPRARSSSSPATASSCRRRRSSRSPSSTSWRPKTRTPAPRRTWRASSTPARRCCPATPLRWHYRSRARAADRVLQPPHLRRLAGHLPVGRAALAADGRRVRARPRRRSTTAGAARATGARRRSSPSA